MLLEAAYNMAMDENAPMVDRHRFMKTYLDKVEPDLKAIEVKADVDMVIEAIEQRIIDPAS